MRVTTTLRTAAERIDVGELLIEQTLNPVVIHRPRHPAQRDTMLTSLCGRDVVFVLPDVPRVLGRELRPCPQCERAAKPLSAMG
jgi:hypothetical protein